jgi:hypothetical protein
MISDDHQVVTPPHVVMKLRERLLYCKEFLTISWIPSFGLSQTCTTVYGHDIAICGAARRALKVGIRTEPIPVLDASHAMWNALSH